MGVLPIAGQCLVQGPADLVGCVRSLLSGQTFVENRNELSAGDWLLDLEEIANPSDRLWCCEKGVGYVGLSLPTEATRTTGPTAILGAGACPALVSHFVRIAVRDFAHKVLRRSGEDPRRPELMKLLRADDFPKLVRLTGIYAIHVVAEPSPLRSAAVASLREYFTTSEPCLIEFGALEPFRRGDLGIRIHGYGRNDWWTGCTVTDAGQMPTAASVVAAARWLGHHPSVGEIRAERLPYEEILEVALPYLGNCASRAVA